MVAPLLADLTVFHYVNGLLSLGALFYILLITNIMVTRDWDMIAGRVFANREFFKTVLRRLIILLSVYAVSFTIQHAINMFAAFYGHWLASVMHTIGISAVLLTVATLYDLLHSMSTTHDEN